MDSSFLRIGGKESVELGVGFTAEQRCFAFVAVDFCPESFGDGCMQRQ